MVQAGVLIVEDEAITAMEISRILESSGYKVLSIVHTGTDAIKEAIKLQPDIIIMDIILKGEMDGIEAARKIRDFHDTPILYLTALESADIDRLKNTCGVGYLHKPISEGELCSNVELTLHNYRNSKKKIEKKVDDSLRDIKVFMHIIIPQLSSKMKIEDRGMFFAKFHRKFEKYMKPKFLQETGRFNRGVTNNLTETEKFQIYLSWITNFFTNLGFEVEVDNEFNQWWIILKDCAWCERNYENVFYCLVCQAILKQTFSWSDIRGFVESRSDIKLSKPKCKYEIMIQTE